MIHLEQTTKRFGDVLAVDDLSLEIREGEFMALVGPSGCGKTTVLRLIAGLETPTTGHISIGGRRVDNLEPKDRNVAMVFQSYALYPHLTVWGNLAFPLQMHRKSKGYVLERVRAVAELLHISELLDRRPKQLSGGQKQRVALGRAMVREPSVFLMDEPLANLDAHLRANMRAELVELHQRLGTTFVYVTHDLGEAAAMADRLAVMQCGRLQQCGAIQELRACPGNEFVAEFVRG